MSRWTKLGTVTDTCDREVTVFRHDAGVVRLIGQEDALEFEPAERDKLREMLDRAAMTGQEESAPASGCGHCGARITLLGSAWTAEDGTTACTDTSAPYVPHKPKES
jgi:hypothetical protein